FLTLSLYFNYRAVNSYNRVLIGQKVNMVFNESNMTMTTKIGEKVLYRANFQYSAIKKVVSKQDLVFVYFDNTSVVVIPKYSFKTRQDYKRAMELVGNNYVV
ncbi:MAG: YcxB family protein, partial [Clostridia bacterium]